MLIAETQDSSLQKLLAAKGEGVIFLPHFTTKSLVQDKKLVKIGQLKDVFLSYYIIYGQRKVENPAADIILNQDFEKMRLG